MLYIFEIRATNNCTVVDPNPPILTTCLRFCATTCRNIDVLLQKDINVSARLNRSAGIQRFIPVSLLN